MTKSVDTILHFLPPLCMEICLESVHMVVACATGKTCRFQYYQERGQKLVHRTETLFEITTQLSWTPNDARTIRTPTNNKAIVQKNIQNF